MDVKDVTRTAREYITDLFADEQITNLGLEEVVYDVDSEQWRITFGFARPWDRQGDMGVRMGLKAPRAYKVVRVDDSNGRVVALTDRILPDLNASRSAQDVSSAGADSDSADMDFGHSVENPAENEDPAGDEWHEVHQLIAKITEKAVNGGYVFRGEAKHFPKVSSGLYRELEKAVEAGYSLADFEIPDINDARNYTGENDDWKLLSHLQHYESVTNLVDFTMDVKVALFFACEDHIREDGRIIILERKYSDTLRFHEPKSPEDRVPAQKSVLVKPKDGVIQNWRQVNVPSTLKVRVMEHLQQCHRIDHRSMYEGYHGYIKLRHRYRKAFAHVDKAKEYMDKKEHRYAVKHLSVAIDRIEILSTFKAIDVSNGLASAYWLRTQSYEALGMKGCAERDRSKFNRLAPPTTERILEILGTG